MNYVCKICKQQIENNGHFWETHRQKISDYFNQYDSRKTVDGKQVIFKESIEKYFETDFNSIAERNTWAKQNIELAKEYFINLLIKRKEKKSLIYAPGEALLRLSDLPKIEWFNKNFDRDYNQICKDLGFKIKYTNLNVNVDLTSKILVQVDTREQNSLIFGRHIEIISKKLDYGDIALIDNTKIAVERKSLNDLCGTIGTNGYERFKRELNRAKKDKGYLVILCESSLNDFKSIEFLPQTKRVKASYSWLAKRIRDLYLEFDNIQFVFCEGRKHAVKITEIILKLGKKIKKTDIQFLIDSKRI
jgi:hypothetical protein